MKEDITSHPNFKKYSDMAKKIAKAASKNYIFDEEDIYQELMLKLVQRWDYIHSYPDDPRGPDRLAKAVLKNKAVDITYYCMNRPDTSIFCKETNFIDKDEATNSNVGGTSDIFEKGEQLSDGSRFDNPEDHMSGVDFIKLLQKISDESDDDRVKNYISTIIEEEEIERLEDLNSSYEEVAKKNRNRSYVSPFLRGKLLGYSPSFPYKVMILTRELLLKNGYFLNKAIMDI